MQDKHLISVRDIAKMLNLQITALVTQILPRGVREGHEWRIGGVDGAPGRSMAVHLGGPKMGVWMDFSTGEAGDALELVTYVLCRGDKSDAIRWARRWLGIDRDPTGAVKRAKAEAERVEKTNKKKENEIKKACWRIWGNSAPAILNTPVDWYLQGRGIYLSEMIRIPKSLRYCPSLHCKEIGHSLPAMVALITNHLGYPVGIHRTWLDVQGCVVKKAALVDPKKTLGRYRGGIIPLWRGTFGQSWAEWRQKPPEVDFVGLSEGIEDGLTIAMIHPSLRIAAGVSGGNYQAIKFPDKVGVWLIGQNDTEPDAIKAFQNSQDNFRAQGREVKVSKPPKIYKDFNEMLQKEGRRKGIAHA